MSVDRAHTADSVPHATVPALPRAQEGSSPQHLLVTLLGDYWLREQGYLPSAALVRLLGEFGVTDVGARAALTRLSRRSVVEPLRQGRHTAYRLTPAATTALERGARRIVSFGRDETWDGAWRVVAFSVPEGQRAVRHLLRSRLRWLGFAPLYDAVWVSPTADTAAVLQALEEFGQVNATVIRATDLNRDFTSPVHAWDLAGARALYDRFIDDTDRLLDSLTHGQLTPVEALVARTTVMDTYRRFPALDPQLPSALLPAGWPREHARRLFVTAYDDLGPLAEFRVQQIVAGYDSALARRARFRRVVDLA